MHVPRSLTTWRSRAATVAVAAAAAMIPLTGATASATHPAGGAVSAQAHRLVHDSQGYHVVYLPKTAAQVAYDVAHRRNFTNQHVCTHFANGSGNAGCVAASSVTAGTQITGNTGSTNLRYITAVYQGFPNAGNPVYRLKFVADTSECIGFSANVKGEVRDCNGNSNNTNWQGDTANTPYFNTVYWSNNSIGCTSLYGDLVWDGTGGDQLTCTSSSGFHIWDPAP